MSLTAKILADAAKAREMPPPCVAEFITLVNEGKGTLVDDRMMYRLDHRLPLKEDDKNHLEAYINREYLPEVTERTVKKVMVVPVEEHLYRESKFWTEISLWVPPTPQPKDL